MATELFGYPRRLTLDDGAGRFRRDVARRQPRSAGREDQVGDLSIAPLDERADDVQAFVGTSSRAVSFAWRAVTQVTIASPDPSARSPREQASDIVSTATRIGSRRR